MCVCVCVCVCVRERERERERKREREKHREKEFERLIIQMIYGERIKESREERKENIPAFLFIYHTVVDFFVYFFCGKTYH